MFVFVQIIRDGEGAVTERKILHGSSLPVKPDGIECEIVEAASGTDISRLKASVDGNGVLFLEDDDDKIAATAAEADIAIRMKRIQFGQRLVAIMSIRNDAKDLTGEQVVQLIQDFAAINTAWLNGMIETSRAMVNAITPDETILTTADKTAILAEIDANLAALGYE